MFNFDNKKMSVEHQGNLLEWFWLLLKFSFAITRIKYILIEKLFKIVTLFYCVFFLNNAALVRITCTKTLSGRVLINIRVILGFSSVFKQLPSTKSSSCLKRSLSAWVYQSRHRPQTLIRQKVCAEGLDHLAHKQGHPVLCYVNLDDGALHWNLSLH